MKTYTTIEMIKEWQDSGFKAEFIIESNTVNEQIGREFSGTKVLSNCDENFPILIFEEDDRTGHVDIFAINERTLGYVFTKVEEDNMNNNIDIGRAKLVYNDFLKLQKSTEITNPLLDDDGINELLGFATDSTIYNLQYLLGYDRGEDESFNVMLESIDNGVSFDEMLEELNKVCGVR